MAVFDVKHFLHQNAIFIIFITFALIHSSLGAASATTGAPNATSEETPVTKVTPADITARDPSTTTTKQKKSVSSDYKCDCGKFDWIVFLNCGLIWTIFFFLLILLRYLILFIIRYCKVKQGRGNALDIREKKGTTQMNPTYVPTAADECRAFEEKDEEEQYQTVEQYQRPVSENYDDVEQEDEKAGETYEELANIEEPPGYQGVIERPLPIPQETIKTVDDEVIYEDPTSEYTTMIHEAQIAPTQEF